jgi:16S rRNA (guanine527-N7)-methyltransferase
MFHPSGDAAFKGTTLDTGFTDLILEFTGKAGISLTQRQAQLLSLHIQLLLQWNTRLNLTRITAREEIIVKHLLDSILPAKFLPSSGSALDVGTGAGFPGIPLKIVSPGLQTLLLDSSRKKVSFLATVAASLGLKGIRAMHGRWQDFPQAEQNLDKLQLITMRAVKLEPEHITSLASMTLAPGGLFAWWGGPGEVDGSECGRKTFDGNYRDIEFQGAFSYLLPGIERQRAVWVWKKTGIS